MVVTFTTVRGRSVVATFNLSRCGRNVIQAGHLEEAGGRREEGEAPPNSFKWL